MFNIIDESCPQLDYDQFIERLLCRNASVIRLGFFTAPLSNGIISSYIGLLTNLDGISVTNKAEFLSGTLPTQLALLTRLEQLSVCCNNLTGDLSQIDWSKMTNLFDVGLHHNRFTGNIPASLVSLPSLHKIRTYNNRFSGSFPTISPDVICSLVRSDINDMNCFSNCQHCECDYAGLQK